MHAPSEVNILVRMHERVSDNVLRNAELNIYCWNRCEKMPQSLSNKQTQTLSHSHREKEYIGEMLDHTLEEEREPRLRNVSIFLQVQTTCR